jgi:hypothetical protein
MLHGVILGTNPAFSWSEIKNMDRVTSRDNQHGSQILNQEPSNTKKTQPLCSVNSPLNRSRSGVYFVGVYSSFRGTLNSLSGNVCVHKAQSHYLTLCVIRATTILHNNSEVHFDYLFANVNNSTPTFRSHVIYSNNILKQSHPVTQHISGTLHMPTVM